MRSAAASLAGAVEREVRLAVDAICPTEWLAAVGKAFEDAYPHVSLHVRSDVLGGVVDLVARGQVDLAVCGPEGITRPVLDARFLFELEMVPVVAATHPLARRPGPLDQPDLVGARQIVIGRRGKDDPDGDRAVLSPTTWRVADAATKRELILAGLGWGNLPRVMVEGDLAAGRLARLRIAAFGDAPLRVRLHRLTRRDQALGPAAQWLAEHLHACPPDGGGRTRADAKAP
ncbi:MAG: LysR family transcriptional regulator [Deltaproteobacteria bacterium]|nr:MAG: LysR family transcriptional regulator [Deltaproteobacteria bacterium]